MDIVLTIVWVLALLTTLSRAFRGGVDSPNWELRWQLLEATDRTRISTAARSGTKLDDLEEAELAAGFTRRDRRRRAYVELPLLSLVVVLAAMAVVGSIDGGFVAIVTGCATACVALWGYLRGKHMDGTPRAAASPDAGR
ncbi:MAG TPA: hypothetical protein VHZ54_08330 [Solirubrobacterales bacterium]|nr:hypothetical protein [Solirubrobacterales bacterium]